MDELISRKAVLELPRNITRNMRGKVVEESIDVELIEALEAYVPDKNVGKTETSCESNTEITRCSDDTISRQAVIDLLKQMRKDGDMVPWEGKNVFDRIRKLPPAQPKRKKGQWIDKSNGIEGAWNYCSVCGEQAIDLYDFCPNCGADMRGNEDGAD